MEKTLNSNERVRRAEEIYARRQNVRERTKRATVNISEPKNFKLLKKIILQIIICVLIYFIFYLINTTNYSFSNETIDKTKELLSTDTDFAKIYDSISQMFGGYIENLKLDGNIVNEENKSNEEILQKQNEVQGEEQKEEAQTGEEQTGIIDNIEENEQTGEESLREVNVDETERIKNKFSFLIPVNRMGYI